MNIQSAINKDVFIPRDERMLVAVEVWRRKRKRMSFLPRRAKGDYATFICVSVTNTRPHQLLITKVKKFGDSSSFTRRSQWMVEQLQQVNGINPNKILYHACQTYWESKAGSLGKAGKLGKLGRASQGAHHEVEAGPSHSSPGSESKILQARKKSYVPPRQTEFINCQSKLTGDACTMNLVIYRCKAFLNRLKKMMVANQSRSPGRADAANSSMKACL
uniref:syntaxin-binding protein 6-like isoform X4 n=1 Tax=Monopterus albus TaxID=43700 RepID=UPI0009B49625|nr:syntaxin-binding protein 6-like isoform X4 [Monopterus albus]